MLLKNLQLTNFRNYSRKEFTFSSKVTVIVGANASGKTNILEAIYLLSTGRSFRAGLEREMIREGEEVARVRGLLAASDKPTKEPSGTSFSGSADPRFQGSFVSTNTLRSNKNNSGLDLLALRKSPLRSLSLLEKKRLEAILTTGLVLGKEVPSKRLLVNGVGKRLVDFVGNLPAVLFWPEDLELVTDSPSLRRRYLDNVLSLVDREYRRASLAYEKALRVRNKLLQQRRADYIGRTSVKGYQKGLKPPKREMEYWEEVLVEKGTLITKKREEFLEFLNKKDRHNSYAIATGIWLSFGIEYLKSEISHKRLREYEEKEMVLGMTLVGPHRDDFSIVKQMKADKEADLNRYGSRGEQRLAVLWLKLGEMEFVAQKVEARPILLLDDILSELDHEHRRLVLEIVPKQQTIITTTDWHFLEKSFLQGRVVINLQKDIHT